MESNDFMDIIHEDEIFGEMGLDLMQGMTWIETYCTCKCKVNTYIEDPLCPEFCLEDGCPNNHL